jgi:putative transposase
MSKSNPERDRSTSIIPKGHDATQPGAYFVTVCTHRRECLLGEIREGEMILNDLGNIVLQALRELPARYHNILLDAFCVMPNHFHAIIVITDPEGDMNGEAGREIGEGEGGGVHPPSIKRGPPIPTRAGKTPSNRQGLRKIVRGLKSSSTRLINRQRGTPGVRVWQRNYSGYLIRTEGELVRFRAYIRANPRYWQTDDFFE